MRILEKAIFILGLISVRVDCCQPKEECRLPLDSGTACNGPMIQWRFGYVKGQCHPRGFPCKPGICKSFQFR